jgi:hypothetical protein
MKLFTTKSQMVYQSNMKELNRFLSSDPEIDFLAISFPHLPVTFIGLKALSDPPIFLATDMIDIAERREIGILQVVQEAKFDKSMIEERLRGGRLVSFEYLANPVIDRACGLRLILETGTATVVAGDAPYSICFEFGGISRGRSEFDMADYHVVLPGVR